MDWKSEKFDRSDPRHVNTGFAIDTMHLSCKNGKLGLLKSMIEDKSEMNRLGVNWRNRRGATALMTASQYGHLDCVKYLISRNAKVEAKRRIDGSTPLIIAAKHGQLNCVKALHQTASYPKKLERWNMFQVVKEALARSPIFYDLNVSDDLSRIISEFVVSYGADLLVKNNEDRNAIEMAELWGQKNVIQYLSKFYPPKKSPKVQVYPRGYSLMDESRTPATRISYGIAPRSRTDTRCVRSHERPLPFTIRCKLW